MCHPSNADCLSRYPLPSAANAPVLDWTKGEVLAPVTFLALMVGATPASDVAEEERDIWEDAEVLNLLIMPAGSAIRTDSIAID